MTNPSDNHLTSLTPVSPYTTLGANLPAESCALKCTTTPPPPVPHCDVVNLVAAIGSDKPSFSLPSPNPPDPSLQPLSAGPTSADKGCCKFILPENVVDYLAAAMAESTRRAYRSDLRSFLAWGGCIPASPEVIAAYLAESASTLSPVTLSRRLVAIGKAHRSVGLPDPCRTELVRSTLRGIWRLHGRPRRQIQPALREDILAMLPHMKGVRGVRDRALILIGFAGAFRRSELVALTHEDITFVKEGVTLTVKRSKTDQLGRGRRVAIPYARSHACPVKALVAWLDVAGIDGGPVFRTVGKAGAIGVQALSAQTVAALVKEYAAKAGLSANQYSGHSLRAGLITSAAKAGVSSWKIRQQTGHKSEAMLQRYIRDAEIFDGNAAGIVL